MNTDYSNIKALFITKDTDGLKRLDVGEIYTFNNQYYCNFGSVQKTHNWIDYAIKSGRAKPYVTNEDYEKHLHSLRTSGGDNVSPLFGEEKVKVQ